MWPDDGGHHGLREPRAAAADRGSRGSDCARFVLLIYADPGMGGESTRQAGFYAAARQPKEIWKVPGAKHTGGLDAQPTAYERRVVAFFDRTLLSTP